MSANFFEVISKRRSIYSLEKKIPFSEAELEKNISLCIENAPSAFNSQNGRVVLLFGKNHDKLWDIVESTLAKKVSADKFEATKQKIASFRAGYGSVLFFEDTDVIKSMQDQFPSYKENFPKWSKEAIGMLQYLVWTALAAQGIGASLQHYNPLIDAEVAQAFDIPANWSLVSQMPFGGIGEQAGKKEHIPLDQRFKIYK